MQGNYIGLNAAGTAALGNTQSGISISSGATNNTIGGTAAAARNVISGSTGSANILVNGNGAGLDSGHQPVSQ